MVVAASRTAKQHIQYRWREQCGIWYTSEYRSKIDHWRKCHDATEIQRFIITNKILKDNYFAQRGNNLKSF